MEEFPIHKIQISGSILASLLYRSSSAAGDIHGYLFGVAALSTPKSLSDDHTETSIPLLTLTITSFLSLPSHLPLPLPLPPPSSTSSPSLIGWFSARRRSHPRPSLKESASTKSLFSSSSLSFTPQNCNFHLPPSLLLLLTTPFQDQLIHTHEYKAFQYHGGAFEPKSVDIMNIGPSFRSQYDSFSPNVAFPMIDFELRGASSSAMVDDKDIKSQLKDQKQLDMVAKGFEVGRLGGLAGSQSGYTGEIEDLYDKMLAKVHELSISVEKSNAEVLKQEKHNTMLRNKVAGLE